MRLFFVFLAILGLSVNGLKQFPVPNRNVADSVRYKTESFDALVDNFDITIGNKFQLK